MWYIYLIYDEFIFYSLDRSCRIEVNNIIDLHIIILDKFNKLIYP